MITGNCMITGGTGTLGHAIVERATAENWPCTFTVFSRDPLKQQQMKREYPQCRYVLGDIRNYDSLYLAMLGHDIVIHAAAIKHIPQAEESPNECISINIDGTRNVATAAIQSGVKQVAFISTDKAAAPINIYGASKLVGEYVIREANKHGLTSFHMCRYGNVLGSNGSVLQVWQRQLSEGKKPTITHPDMTRFWLTEQQAVDIVIYALKNPPGTITIPLAPALDMKSFAQYLLGDEVELETIGLRPGEKMHECLLTVEESPNAVLTTGNNALVLFDSPQEIGYPWAGGGYHSDDPLRWLMAVELRQMVGVKE